MASIVPSERLRRELEDVIDGAGEAEDPIEAIGRLGDRLILQQALEEELTEFLGRERYERRGEPLAHRNGYEPVTVKTTAGRLELERPRLRNASALGFASAIVGKGVARTHALEALVVCSFLRGLSLRDVDRGAGGGLRRSARLEVDGGADLYLHARELPRLVRPTPGRARPRLLLPGRALPEAPARRHAGRGRARRLEGHAGGSGSRRVGGRGRACRSRWCGRGWRARRRSPPG